jgi:hypothetical protein
MADCDCYEIIIMKLFLLPLRNNTKGFIGNDLIMFSSYMTNNTIFMYVDSCGGIFVYVGKQFIKYVDGVLVQ